MISDFKTFLLKTNALALAIAVIIGIALGGVVNSLVNDIIMPPVGQALGKVDFSQLKIVLQAAAGDAPEVAIRWGAFINTIISFVVIAIVVWQISRMFLQQTPEPPTKTCPYCRESVALDASKCRYCGSVI